MEKLKEILNYLEENIDLTHIEDTKRLIKDCLEFRDIDRHVMKTGYNSDKFTRYSYKETTLDMKKMLFNELVGSVAIVDVKDDSVPSVRANYGVGTLPSVFGLNSRIVNDNLPWVDHLNDIDDVKRLIDKGIPDLDTGFGKKVLETYECYNEALKDYPNCKAGISLYHADLQGPFDVAHLIMGSEIYYAIYDDPDIVKELLDLVCDTYILYMKRMKPYINDEWDNYCNHWGTLYSGKILLRNDSPVNLSKDAYLEFVKPYDEKILEAFGSGSMHFCGRADQWVLEMADTKNLKAMNFGYMPNIEFGQKYLEFVYPTYEKIKMPICNYTLSKADASSLDFNKYKKGITFDCNFGTFEAAKAYLDSIR